MHDELKVRVPYPVLDVLARPSEEIVHHDHVMPLVHKPVDEM